MKTKSGTAAGFGITLTGRPLDEFNRRYKAELYKEYSLRSKVLTALGALSMAGISVWMLAANVSSPAVMLLMMIPPAAGAVVVLLSMFEKNNAAAEQLRSCAALAMFIVLMITTAYVCDSDRVLFTAGGRLLAVGGKGYMPLYAFCMGIILFGVLCGLRGWGRWYMKVLGDRSRSGKKKPDYGVVGLIAVSVVPVVRAVMQAAEGRADLRFVMLVIVLVTVCAGGGFILGIGAGNVRYMRYLDTGGRER